MEATQKKARRKGRAIALIDESGFMLQPVQARTWAPRGQTPVLECWARHDRLSVISAITVSPKTRNVGLYFQIHRHNIFTKDVLRFVRTVRRKLGRKLIVVWDGLNAHKSAARKLSEDVYDVIRLPGYAPDLNPDEWVWRHAKHVHLRNRCPDDLDELEEALELSLEIMHQQPDLLRSFFKDAELTL